MTVNLKAADRRLILLVCTGNTCRSPMAAALLRDALARRLGDAAGAYQVHSAGLHVARIGAPATATATCVLAEHGLDLAGHRAQEVDEDLLADAALILTMTTFHKETLLAMYPAVADRLYTLCEYTQGPGGLACDIQDPIGGNLARYRATAARLAEEISRLVDLIAGEEEPQLPQLTTPKPPPTTASSVTTVPAAGKPEPALGLLAVSPKATKSSVRRLAVGADHNGYKLKDELGAVAAAYDIEVVDYGTDSATSCDYPDYAAKVARAVASGSCQAGLLVCGTGLGMAIAANKLPGVRAVTCNDLFSARLAREHNDANMLCLGARITGPGLATEILETFLATPYAGDRHNRRLAKIADLEQPAGPGEER